MDEKTNRRFDQATTVISTRIRMIILQLPENIVETIQEIRLRVNSPTVVVCPMGSRFLTNNGKLTSVFSDNCVIVSPAELSDTLNRVCSYSIHTNQQGINSGFITINGGHRVGVCGTAVSDGKGIISVKDISSINIRFAKEVLGVASPLVELMADGNLKSLIIAGPPSSGKTTMLRDFARQLSSGYTGRYVKTVVVDERGEIGATSNGIMQNDLGLNTDILNNYTKAVGTELAIRSLSPEYIIFDEICTDEEALAIEQGLNSGVFFAVSVHASSEKEIESKALIQRLIKTGAFSNIVLLKNYNEPCIIEKIIDLGEKSDEDNWNSECFSDVYSDRTATEFTITKQN